MSDETKVVRMPAAIAQRLSGMPMEQRAALVARALSAHPESLGEVSVAETEAKMKVALPEGGELVAGLPAAGSPVVVPKTVWTGGRNGFGEPVEWPGAVVYLPPDSTWFLSLDDASRASAVRASLARARDREAEREERLAAMSNPEDVERPSHIPAKWEPVTVWVPGKEACWPIRIQALVERGLGVEKQPGSLDLEAFLTEKKAQAAKKVEGAQ